MIRVNYGTSLERHEALVHPDTTIREFLEENNIDYSVNSPFLDSTSLGAGDLDKSFADFNITDHCRLSVIVKAVNA